jgi:hypothetical protein
MLRLLPEGVKNVRLRSDSAAYQWDLMEYCARGDKKRFDVIDFAISCNVYDGFRAAAQKVPDKKWKPLLRDKEDVSRQEWAEVAYVPENLSKMDKNLDIRFYAIREVFLQRRVCKKKLKDAPGQMDLGIHLGDDEISELESVNPKLKKFHLTSMSGNIYKLFGVASNIMYQNGDEIILWHRERCGKSEQAHDILKNDFGGGHVPSYQFGVNAVWWNIAVLAMNVSNAIKRFFLPRCYKSCRMKTLRYLFFTLPGKVVTHARQKILKVYSQDAGANLLIYAMNKLNTLLPGVT